MAYKIYTTSTKAWDAMLTEIDKAKKSIFLEMYAFLDDTSASHDFFGKLKEKSRQGLKITIVADAFGSSELKKESIASLRKAGIEFIFFSDWLRRIHRKVLIIDEKIAFIGGANIGKRFRHWKDIQLRLTGKQIVSSIMISFAYTYEMSGGKDLTIIRYRKKSKMRKLKMWFLENWPIKGMHSLRSHYTKKISGAQSTVRIVTPYLTPPRWFIALLDTAMRRGVKIEIIIPQKTNHPVIDRISHHYMHNLSAIGVNFYLAKEMNHAKIMLIDSSEGLVGSQNIDILSFHFNAESGVFFQKNNMVSELEKIFLHWKKIAVPFKQNGYGMGPIDYLIFPLIKLIYHLL